MSRSEQNNLFQSIRLSRAFDESALLNNINIVNDSGESLLHEAIAFNNDIAGQYLIDSGIDINKSTISGLTPLHYAAQYKNSLMAKLILFNASYLEKVDNHGNSPLWTAVFNAKGNYEIVKLFVQAGMDVNLKNKYDKSPLDFALQIKEERLIDILKRKKS